jgi:hypothetical protein
MLYKYKYYMYTAITINITITIGVAARTFCVSDVIALTLSQALESSRVSRVESYYE